MSNLSISVILKDLFTGPASGVKKAFGDLRTTASGMAQGISGVVTAGKGFQAMTQGDASSALVMASGIAQVSASLAKLHPALVAVSLLAGGIVLGWKSISEAFKSTETKTRETRQELEKLGIVKSDLEKNQIKFKDELDALEKLRSAFDRAAEAARNLRNATAEKKQATITREVSEMEAQKQKAMSKAPDEKAARLIGIRWDKKIYEKKSAGELSANDNRIQELLEERSAINRTKEQLTADQKTAEKQAYSARIDLEIGAVPYISSSDAQTLATGGRDNFEQILSRSNTDEAGKKRVAALYEAYVKASEYAADATEKLSSYNSGEYENEIAAISQKIAAESEQRLAIEADRTSRLQQLSSEEERIEKEIIDAKSSAAKEKADEEARKQLATRSREGQYEFGKLIDTKQLAHLEKVISAGEKAKEAGKLTTDKRDTLVDYKQQRDRIAAALQSRRESAAGQLESAQSRLKDLQKPSRTDVSIGQYFAAMRNIRAGRPPDETIASNTSQMVALLKEIASAKEGLQ